VALFRIALSLLAGFLRPRPANAQELNVGDQAPEFSLPATDGRTYTLSGLKGRTVVLAWFPKALTSG
jgi:peroxiredoxin